VCVVLVVRATEFEMGFVCGRTTIRRAFYIRTEGGMRVCSLKVADLSVQLLKDRKQGQESGAIIETWPSILVESVSRPLIG
jgi:hypothetical protein